MGAPGYRNAPFTDDLGHFRISGLPAGEYILNSSFQSSGLFNLFGETEKTLNIYYGDVFFQKDAKPIKIGEGEESTGNNITIPLSKIHSISGSLLNVSGHIINAGDVALYTMPTTAKSHTLRSNRRTPPFTWTSFQRAITFCA